MMKLTSNDKILIVRLTALGDCLHTIPLACAIKKAYPDVFIGWAVSEKCKDIILNNPIIDKVHIIPKNDCKAYANKMSEIREEKYTIAIDSQELLKSALVSWRSGAKNRLAHDKSREFSYLFANKRLEAVSIFDTSRHVIERNMDFAKYLGIKNYDIEFSLPDVSDADKKYVEELIAPLDKSKKTIAIAPSTTWITKFWTKENWAKVIEELNGHANIILTGGNGDIAYTQDILKLSNCSTALNLVGQTNLLQLKYLFEKIDILITPDSGSAHLASAIQKPNIICLFGATSSVRNGAFGENNINLSYGLNCQPCYKKCCKFTDEIPECMTHISPDVVIEKVKNLL